MDFRNFYGCVTALITPFKSGKIDELALANIIEHNIKNGIAGLTPCGSTGEAATLNEDEHKRVIELTVNVAKPHKIPVIAGAGTNDTNKTVKLSKAAKDAGADALLLVTPYYNKPTQEGMYQHFMHVADNVDLPIILYNIPGRSVVNLTDDTIVRLAKHPNIVGIKDATADLDRPCSLLKKIDKDFLQLTGDDATAIAFNACGGKGVISVASNIFPEICVKIQNLMKEGNFAEALKLHLKLKTIIDVLFIETNPMPIKYIAHLMGFCEEEYRLPLVTVSLQAKEAIKNAIEKFKKDYE